MKRRIFGLENEYGLTCTLNGQRHLSPDNVARYLFEQVIPGARNANVFLENGARLYLDTGFHPEYATPECDDVAELVSHEKAGERIVEDLRHQAEKRLREDRTLGAWEEHGRSTRAIREARNELLANADEALRRCYDYLQEAIEEQRKREGQPAYAVFKAMEVLRERFRNDGKAGIVLGETFEQAKQATNAERHIPKKNQPLAKGHPVQLARETIRAYERYLLNPPG